MDGNDGSEVQITLDMQRLGNDRVNSRTRMFVLTFGGIELTERDLAAIETD
jgi:hypothetical protein